MGRTSTRLPSFCLNRGATPVRVRSPPIDSKPVSATVEACQLLEPSANVEESSDGTKKDVELGRRIMVVVDSSPEAKTALQWTLSHSVGSNDTIVLLDIVKPSKHGEQLQRERDPKGSELLCAMKSICQSKRPEVEVEFSIVEGKERGPAIVEEARKQGASLLVMGQKKRWITWRLLMMWAGSKIGSSIVDYCVKNASCMALAVRRKSRRGGGYLITTKRQKDFWLLA
ncbi:uncharacterized protein LOC120106604 [Phoenix dactylifera]|uniref:Uncharacterized protein LOC120106604 n=1 Tax=Phoenix dactylifera TaxID=42345 RepID=A0A8B8ZMP9_PHODC|nr:uncharacterized protein LOC120106604 [Phoenix dactylifera]